jgi:hypothetical protein
VFVVGRAHVAFVYAFVQVAMEQSHDDRVRTWKDQIDKRAVEFEELRAQMAPPRDLEMLRVKIQEVCVRVDAC